LKIKFCVIGIISFPFGKVMLPASTKTYCFLHHFCAYRLLFLSLSFVRQGLGLGFTSANFGNVMLHFLACGKVMLPTQRYACIDAGVSRWKCSPCNNNNSRIADHQPERKLTSPLPKIYSRSELAARRPLHDMLM